MAGSSCFGLIPAIAQEGFFISPTIRTSGDFAELTLGRSNAPRVLSISFEGGRIGSLLYDREVEVAFQEAYVDFTPKNHPSTFTSYFWRDGISLSPVTSSVKLSDPL